MSQAANKKNTTQTVGKKLFLYVCRRPDGQVKIGSTENPSERIRNIETQGGFSLEVIHKLEISGRKIERTLHELFSPHREIGEWFSLTNEQIERIPKLLAELPISIHNESSYLRMCKRCKKKFECDNGASVFCSQPCLLSYIEINYDKDLEAAYLFNVCSKIQLLSKALGITPASCVTYLIGQFNSVVANGLPESVLQTIRESLYSWGNR